MALEFVFLMMSLLIFQILTRRKYHFDFVPSAGVTPSNVQISGIGNYAGFGQYPPRRLQHRMTTLHDGRVVLFGGQDGAAADFLDLWIYERVTNAWTWVNTQTSGTGAFVQLPGSGDRFGRLNSALGSFPGGHAFHVFRALDEAVGAQQRIRMFGGEGWTTSPGDGFGHMGVRVVLFHTSDFIGYVDTEFGNAHLELSGREQFQREDEHA